MMNKSNEKHLFFAKLSALFRTFKSPMFHLFIDYA